MIVIIDSFVKKEAKLQTSNEELMAKKRKLYLHRRVKRSREITNHNAKEDTLLASQTLTTTPTTTSLPTDTEETFICKSPCRSCSFTTAESINNNNKRDNNKKDCHITGDIKYSKELRICLEHIPLNSNNKNNKSNEIILEDSTNNCNCSCNNENNCQQQPHNSCSSQQHQKQQQQHHQHVFNKQQQQHNLTQEDEERRREESLTTTTSRHKHEIHQENSYYLLSQTKNLTDKTLKHTNNNNNYMLPTTFSSCTCYTPSSSSGLTCSGTTRTRSNSLLTSFTNETDATTCKNNNILLPNVFSRSNNNNTSSCNSSSKFLIFQGYKQRFFTKFFMILKMLLVLITTSPLSSPSPPLPTPPRCCRYSPFNPATTKRHKHYQQQQHHQHHNHHQQQQHHYHQNSPPQLQQRLTHFNDQPEQQQCLHFKQKFSYRRRRPRPRQQQQHLQHLSNITLSNMILMGLTFLSIFSMPLTNALNSDFETTLQSSLPSLQRTARDLSLTNEIEVRRPDQVKLTRPEKVCKSLDIRNDATSFRQLENCTVIEGFLLITLLNGNSSVDYNETFPLLTEVTDYIIVYQVHYLRSLGKILPNLSVIRGRALFEGYALVVYSNSHLEELGFSNLMTISRGGVMIEKNVMLCYVKSIDWTQIATNTTEILIDSNRNIVECPACPGEHVSEGDTAVATNELECKERHGRRHCWNSKSCQKFCPKNCLGNCLNENTCCNDSCIGGCSPKNINDCISCRNLSIFNTTCTDKCPKNFYNYLDHRCVTAETCVHEIHSKYENNKQETLVAFDGSCSIGCPEGYTKSNMTCQKCGDKCTKKCVPNNIDSVARARELHGCTHIIDRPLVINIKRGIAQVVDDLRYGLSSIQVIQTSLKVQGTYGLFDLKFFKNLHTIEGETLIDDKFAFYVLENTDMETLWNPNQTVRILKGTVYFHFNPKLCVSEINALLPMVNNQTSFDKTEVSEDSNGVKGTCNTSFLNVTITSKGSQMALAKILNPMLYEDDRTFIGYQLLHMEDPLENATKHTIRACEDSWEVSEPQKDTDFVVQPLKPFTKYAYYIKTLTISTERRNGQSPIQWFTTKADKPKVVKVVRAYSNSSYNIVMNWLPPSTVNGKLIKYIIRAVYDKRIQRIDSRNYCKDPLKEISKPDIPILKPTTEKPPVIPKNCKCTKLNPYDDDISDTTIHAAIEFENALQNFVYVKKEYKGNKTKPNDFMGQDTNSINRKRRALESDDQVDSFLLRHIRDVPQQAGDGNELVTSTMSTPSYVSTNENGVYNESRMDAVGEYFEIIVEDVNATTTEFVFSKLKHFSWYMLSVQACREIDPTENNTADACSMEVKTHIRTLKLDNVDRVDDLRAERETTNSSRSNVRLLWKRPMRPNGAVVSYTISYLLLDSIDTVEEKKCITEIDFVEMGYQENGYVLTNLNSGNYSIRIRTNTLAGEGQYSKTIYMYIPPITLPPGVIAGIAIGVVSVLLIIGGAIYYLFRKRILAPPSDLKIFPSVNPHYISLQYIPDEWEVARDRVLQLNPLGQGSFGMVYEGILKGYNNSNEDTPCAVKTVNENATDRERMNFLNEACVMKQFDTFHVVRLLGVCSRGQPALVVMELMKNGDLKSYLRAHRPDERDEMGMPILGRSGVSTQPPPLSRIYQMAIEIADGMAYLAAKKFVHRDLAARNCMVAADLTVKIGDFGMTRDIYENDYYRKGTKGLLPVRWMPPESLRDGVYSTASDVFSYGVVLWEMATLASQPYQGFSNDQVLRYVIDGGVMERPENCPDKLYTLMQKCWHHRPSARPTFMEIIRFLFDLADPHFRDVSFYHSDEGQQTLAKEIAEHNQRSGDIFHDQENDMEDVTTPLRLEEYSGYKLNMDNNSSVEHRADSSMVMDEDAPHSPYSLTGSPMVVSSTPDEQLRNSFNMSRIMNPQMLNSAPSTSAGLRKLIGPSTSQHHISHPHTHPYHRNLYQPTRYTQHNAPRQQQRRTDDVDNYVQPDFEPGELAGSKRDSDEQGYEMYDPSPNYSEKASCNVHDEDDDEDMGLHSTAGQNLLARPKGRQARQPTIMPLSSSMPDDVIGQQAASSLHPSTASAASSNTSSKTGTGKYPTLRAVADSLGNRLMPATLRNMRIFNHKRSGSNASYKSTSSNPNSTTGGGGGAAGSSSNLARSGRGKSMSGQNLGTIESGGSGSAGSYCANPRFFTPNSGTGVSDNPNYKRLDDGSRDTLTNKPKLPSATAFSISSNPNYQALDESLNTTGASYSNHPVVGTLHTSENPNYQIMQAPASTSSTTTTPTTENTSSYVMMNEPNQNKGPNNSSSISAAISISDNPNYQMMGPPPPSSFLAAPPPPPSSSSLLTAKPTVLPQPPLQIQKSRNKFSSSSSAASTSSSHDTDEDDNGEDDDDEDDNNDVGLTSSKKGIKSDRILLSRRSSNDRSQTKKKHNLNNRSRSQSSSSGKSSSGNTTTTTSQQQPQQQQSKTTTTPSSTLTLKEKWWKEQPQTSSQQQPPPPPPNGFVGRETSS